jgi:hypothetical protein
MLVGVSYLGIVDYTLQLHDHRIIDQLMSYIYNCNMRPL